VDEFDPAWSKTGSRIAFTSDRATSAAGSPAGGRPRDTNIWVLRAARPAELVQVTANAAWDDSPSWSGDDRVIYFRSTRGGEWGVWSIDLPQPGR
jgi:Tol biopolymer transport system component